MKLRHLCKILTLLSNLIVLVLLSGGPAPARADAQNVDLVGHHGGEVRAVFVQGNYAYIGEGYSLAILNISNPARPTAVGKSGFFPSVVLDVAVSGNYAYVADAYDGLRVVDVSNPAAPVEVGYYDTPGWGSIRAVAVAGNYAYIADQSNGLRVVNVSNPAVPVPVGQYDSPGTVYDVAVSDSYVYLADGYSGLRVVNISNPAAPVEAGFYDSPGTTYGVVVAGDYAYIADGSYSLRIISISNPTAPALAGSYTMPNYGTANKVAVAGSYAYVIDQYNGLLQVVNISDPATPVGGGSYDMPGYAYNVAAAGSYTYVANEGYGLRVVNASDPAAPALAGFYVTLRDARSVAVSGSYAYIADYYSSASAYDSLRVVNISTSTAPTGVGFAGTPGGAQDVAVADNYAYLADGDNDLRAIQISNPYSPTVTAYAETPGYANGVAVAGHYVYVADQADGLRIMDISNPAAPWPIGYLDTPGYVYDVAVAGNYAYVADSSYLRVVDVSNPAAPVEVGSLSIYPDAVAVAGNYAYVVTGSALQVVNISNPTAPIKVSYLYISGANDVAVAGNYAYVAARSYGLRVIDISNPIAPTEVGYYDISAGTGDYAYGVAIAENYVYVADETYGLLVLRAHPPAVISGRVANAADNPRSGVRVSAGGVISATTNSSGIYVLTNMPTGTYTLTPTLSGYIFSPVTRTVSVPPSAPGQDFTSIQIYTIAGQVTDSSNSYKPLAGVIVSASGGYKATTNASGYYTITTQIAGTYTLTPTLNHYSFSPASRTVSLTSYSPSNTWQDFTGIPSYSVSGQVINGANSPIPGVVISTGWADSATTNSNGVYTLTLSAGSYTLTPSQSGYTFSPAQRTISVPPDVTGMGFTRLDKTRVTPANLIFNATEGGTPPIAKSFVISWNGAGSVNWTAGDNVPWLSLSSTGGVIAQTAPVTVTVSANNAGLSQGDYTGEITINSNEPTVLIIGVTLKIRPPAPGCVGVPTDVMLVLDKSGSMAGQPLNDAKTAARAFVDQLNLKFDQMGLVSFDDVVTLDQTLTKDAATLQTKVDAITSGGNTDIAGAIQQAANELMSSRHNLNNPPVLILLSDGEQTVSGDPISAADQVKRNGIYIISIGLGSADTVTLQTIASSPSDYYYAPNSTELARIFNLIAGTVGCDPTMTDIYLPIVIKE